MTFIELSLDTTDLVSYFQSLDKNIESGMPELHQRFAATLAERAKRAFDEEGYPQRWPPSEAAEKEGRKTLQDTGKLKHSFELQSSDNFFVSSGESMLWGSLVYYGPFHYDERLAKTLREIIVFDDELNEEFSDDLREWLGDMIAK